MENNWKGMDVKKMSNILSKLSLSVEENNKGKSELSNEQRRADAVNSIENILAEFYTELFKNRQNGDFQKIKDTTEYIKHVKEILDTRMKGIALLIDPLENYKLYETVRTALTNKINEIDNKEQETDLEKFVSGYVKLDFEDMVKTLDEAKDISLENAGQKKQEDEGKMGKIIQLPLRRRKKK